MYVVPVKSTVEISQNFVAFSECMNFMSIQWKMFNDIYKIQYNLNIEYLYIECGYLKGLF